MQIPSDQTAVFPGPWPSGLSSDPNRGLPTQPSHGGCKAAEPTPRLPQYRRGSRCHHSCACLPPGPGLALEPHPERKDQAHGGPGRGQAGSRGPQAPKGMPLCVSAEGCMCAPVCVCVSVCVWGSACMVCLFSMCVCACMSVCVSKWGRAHVGYVYLCVHASACTYVFLYMCSCVPLCVCMCVCVCTRGCPC